MLSPRSHSAQNEESLLVLKFSVLNVQLHDGLAWKEFKNACKTNYPVFKRN